TVYREAQARMSALPWSPRSLSWWAEDTASAGERAPHRAGRSAQVPEQPVDLVGSAGRGDAAAHDALDAQRVHLLLEQGAERGVVDADVLRRLGSGGDILLGVGQVDRRGARSDQVDRRGLLHEGRLLRRRV